MSNSGAILVTGGAGYIGSHALLELIDQGERVVVLDDLSAGPPVAPLEGINFVQGNVGDESLVRDLIQKNNIDTIFHFAAFIRVEESMQHPERYFKNNTENTELLIRAAKAEGVKNIIYSSTAAVYGEPKKMPVDESTPTNPVSPYGESKLRAEKLVRQSGMRFIALRYFNVAGADPKGRTGYRIEEKPSHLIRAAIRAHLEGGTLRVFGTDYATPDGSCVRDYIHVSDLARAHTAALSYLRGGGTPDVFNVGNGRGYSVLEVIESVGRVTGLPLKAEKASRREGDPLILVADASRIRTSFDWTPRFTELDTIIKDELAWVKARL